MKLSLLLSLLCLHLTMVALAKNKNKISKLELSVVTRELDLTSNLVREKTTMVVENKDSEHVTALLYTVPRTPSTELAHIGAKIMKNEMEVDGIIDKGKNFVDHPNVSVYEILIPSTAPGGRVTVVIDVVLASELQPFPKEITQNEKQLIHYIGSAHVFSPYPSKTQSTTVKLPSATIESFSRVTPTSTSENVITYGPYNDVGAFAYAKISIHFENNGPFIAVSDLERLIEVSHWGNIAVEEKVHITHEGAKLRGSFSRYDYQRNPQSGPSSVKSYKTILPAAALDVYYRDEIGNISTSHLRVEEDLVELELRPRFPLFGGWQTRYYFGYNLPSYEYLFHAGNLYQLRMRVIDHVFDDQLVRKFTLKIILPEGAKDIDLWTPYAVTKHPQELKYTYLDTLGRPVVVVSSENLVEQHIQEFKLTYTFDKVMLLQEPLLVVTGLYLFYLVVIIAVRLDFSITKDTTLLAKQQARVVIESILQAHDTRASLVSKYQTAISEFKTNKDIKTFKSTKKSLDDKYRSATEQVASQAKELSGLESDAHAKVVEVQRKMVEVKNLLEEICLLAEKVVAGKIVKDKYIEQDKSIMSRIERAQLEVNTVVQTL